MPNISNDRPSGRVVAARLPDDERDRLLKLAKLQDRSVGAEVRRAVRFYLDEFERAEQMLTQSARQRVPR